MNADRWETTILKRFREKFGIEASGKVLFRETEDGETTVEQVSSPSEMRGFAACSEASTDKPASDIPPREARAGP